MSIGFRHSLFEAKMKTVAIITVFLFGACFADQKEELGQCLSTYNIPKEKFQETMTEAVHSGISEDDKARFVGCVLRAFGMIDENGANPDRIQSYLKSQNADVPDKFDLCIQEKKGDDSEIAKGIIECIKI